MTIGDGRHRDKGIVTSRISTETGAACTRTPPAQSHASEHGGSLVLTDMYAKQHPKRDGSEPVFVVTVRRVSSPDAAERLRRAFAMILGAVSRTEEEVDTEARQSAARLDDD